MDRVGGLRREEHSLADAAALPLVIDHTSTEVPVRD
jgi:hypothetical protein